jgi:TolA-binding protein
MKNTVFIVMCLLALAACQSPKEKAIEQIKELEAGDSIFNPEQIEKVKNAYIDFANQYPNDEMSPEYLFKAGQRCNVTAEHEKAIQLFQQVIDQYPKHHMAEEALFLQAYIYENSMQDYAKAKSTYTSFLELYPNSELVEDATYSIQNLGKTPEQILEDFEKGDSAAVKQIN